MSAKKKEHATTVTVLGKTLSIKCLPTEVKDLQLSAEYLNEKTDQFRKNSSMSSPDHLAIIVALNAVNELMLMKKQKNDYMAEVQARISSLKNKIEKFLETEEAVEV